MGENTARDFHTPGCQLETKEQQARTAHPQESSWVPCTITSAHRPVSGCMSCASPAFVSHFICRQGIASVAPLITEKLSVHNSNKPPFCSLSILNTLPVSSMLQLAATQHLFVAAGYVSATLIEQQKIPRANKQHQRIDRSAASAVRIAADWSCTGSWLEMVFFNMYSEYCYSTCISLGRCCWCSRLPWPFSCK